MSKDGEKDEVLREPSEVYVSFGRNGSARLDPGNMDAISYVRGDIVAGMQIELARLKEENEKLSRANASGIAGEIRLTNELSSLRASRERMRDKLNEEAAQLDKWADESRRGGWSTHQVDPMRKRADELRRFAALSAGEEGK